MAVVTIGTLLVLFIPFLLSLVGQAGTPKVLCLVTSILARLLSVEPYRTVLPWTVGLAIAVISVRERIHQLRRWGAAPESKGATGLLPSRPNF